MLCYFGMVSSVTLFKGIINSKIKMGGVYLHFFSETKLIHFLDILYFYNTHFYQSQNICLFSDSRLTFQSFPHMKLSYYFNRTLNVVHSKMYDTSMMYSEPQSSFIVIIFFLLAFI